MANPLKARPVADEIIGKMQELGFSPVAAYALRDAVMRSDKVLTDKGEVQSLAPIKGRSEGIATTAANLNSDGTFNSTDNVHDGSYSLRSFQQSGSALVIDNAGFEADPVQVPGWKNINAVSFVIDQGSPQSGKNALRVTFNGQFQAVGTQRIYAVRPGDTFRISGWVRSDGNCQPYLQLSIFDKSGNLIGSAGTPHSSSATWTFVQATVVAPANSSYAQLWLTNNSASSGSLVAWFDSLQGSRTLTSFEVTPINTAGTPRSTTGLVSQVGATTAMNVASSTWQFGDGTVAYNSGSADPGSLGPYYVTGDDPGFAGGAVPYVPRSTPADANAANGRLLFGNITTTGGGSVVSTGGGTGGGGPKSKAALL